MSYDRKYHVWMFNDEDLHGAFVGIPVRDMTALEWEATRRRGLAENERRVSSARMLVDRARGATYMSVSPSSEERQMDDASDGPAPMDIEPVENDTEVQARAMGAMTLEKGRELPGQILRRVEMILPTRVCALQR